MARRILIATIGSLGDLNPFIGVGQALAAQGASVRLAVPAEQVARVRKVGLDAVAVLPIDAGLPPAAIARGLPRAQLATVREILVGTLPEYTRRLDAMAVGADAIVASPFVLAAPIIAEKRGALLVQALLQPFAFPLPRDPPVSPSLWMLSQHPMKGRLRCAWNCQAIGGIRRFLAVWLGGAVDDVRTEHGLYPVRQSPLFTLESRQALALYPAWFARCATPGLLPTGFVRGRRSELDPELADWLAAGLPPLVFTLGSLAGTAPGKFTAMAIATARKVGRRAVVLAQGPAQQDHDVITRDHVDYAALFPNAAAVIHHGGVGTIAVALAAGKPQIIIPHFGDQFDNAARVSRLGIGRTLQLRHFNACRAVNDIEALLADADAARRIAHLGATVRKQDGAAIAAEAILAQLGRADIALFKPKPVQDLRNACIGPTLVDENTLQSS